MFPQFRHVRHLPRYRRIVTVFARHGFGSALQMLQLDRYLALPVSILRQEPPPHISPAEHLRLALEELGPTFVKLGQVLSTRPDLVPPVFLAELIKLQDSVPPTPWETVRAVLIDELGQAPEDIFAHIDLEPLGAASLAQVYGAILKDGSQVVIKVQRPNIHATIDSDLEILEDLAALAQRTPLGELYNPAEVVAEFAFTLRNELDYRREGRNADRFRANFAREQYLYIPAVHWEYTTRCVLVLERIEGIKIDNVTALDAAGYDRHRVALHAAHIIIKEVLEDGFFHADPHPGNLLVMPDEVIGAMDFGMVGRLSQADRLNLIRLYTVAIRLDAATVVEQLLRMGAAAANVDRHTLEHDISHLLTKYYGLPLKDIHAKEIIEEVIPIAFKHHLRLPPDLWLLGKTLTMMEGVGRQLDPGFDIFEASQPFVRRLMLRMWSPLEWGPGVLEQLDSWRYLVSEMPRIGTTLLRNLEQGDLPLFLRIGANDQTLTHLDRLATRLSLSLLISSLLIGLSFLLPIATGNLYILIPTGIGFLFVLGLGLWFLVSILRGGK
jgi:ubiquinone biosynthesis protein